MDVGLQMTNTLWLTCSLFSSIHKCLHSGFIWTLFQHCQQFKNWEQFQSRVSQASTVNSLGKHDIQLFNKHLSLTYISLWLERVMGERKERNKKKKSKCYLTNYPEWWLKHRSTKYPSSKELVGPLGSPKLDQIIVLNDLEGWRK